MHGYVIYLDSSLIKHAKLYMRKQNRQMNLPLLSFPCLSLIYQKKHESTKANSANSTGRTMNSAPTIFS